MKFKHLSAALEIKEGRMSKSSAEHDQNMDAAQRQIDRREAEGEDMSDYTVDPKTYKIVKNSSLQKVTEAKHHKVKQRLQKGDKVKHAKTGVKGTINGPMYSGLGSRWWPVVAVIGGYRCETGWHDHDCTGTGGQPPPPPPPVNSPANGDAPGSTGDAGAVAVGGGDTGAAGTVSEVRMLGQGMSKAALAADVDQSDREYLMQKQNRREYDPILAKYGFRKQKSGKYYKDQNWGTIAITNRGHWEHLNVMPGDDENHKDFEGTTAITLDKHLSNIGAGR